MKRNACTVVSVTIAMIAAAAGPVLACPVCFQVEQGPVTDGIRAAVVVLMGVTVVVLGGFLRFVVRFARRAETAS
jgi:heme/copper-type cytochrome/quinol oxidase subunit 2